MANLGLEEMKKHQRSAYRRGGEAWRENSKAENIIESGNLVASWQSK